MAGYSGKSLIDKLGYTPGDSVLLFQAPDWFKTLLENEGVMPVDVVPATWMHGFFHSATEVVQLLTTISFDNLKGVEKVIWVSWPKKSSMVPTDLTEQTFRDLILPLGWVDTKVAAIDETWSGLKFLRRKK